MVKLDYKKGLLYTDIVLEHNGKLVVVTDMIVDTGASHSIVSPIFLERLEAEISLEDEIVNSFGLGGGVCSSLRKRIDSVRCGDIIIENFKMDFGEIDPYDRVNGLLGLDFLKVANLVIDLRTDMLLQM